MVGPRTLRHNELGDVDLVKLQENRTCIVVIESSADWLSDPRDNIIVKLLHAHEALLDHHVFGLKRIDCVVVISLSLVDNYIKNKFFDPVRKDQSLSEVSIVMNQDAEHVICVSHPYPKVHVARELYLTNRCSNLLNKSCRGRGRYRKL